MAVGVTVLLGRRSDLGRPQVGIEILEPLPLADGIVLQHDKTFSRQTDGRRPLAFLTFRTVAHGHQDGGKRTLAGGWAVDVGRDVKARHAFVDDLVVAVVGVLLGADVPRAQRCFFRGEPAQQPQDFLAHRPLPLGRRRGGLNRSQSLLARAEEFFSLLVGRRLQLFPRGLPLLRKQDPRFLGRPTYQPQCRHRHHH